MTTDHAQDAAMGAGGSDLQQPYTPALIHYPDDDRLEFVTADVAYFARHVGDGCALLLDMETREPVGFYIEQARARLPGLMEPALATPAPPPVAVPDDVRRAKKGAEVYEPGNCFRSRERYAEACVRWVDTLIAAQPASPGDGAGETVQQIVEALLSDWREYKKGSLPREYEDGYETAFRHVLYRAKKGAARPSAPQAGTAEDGTYGRDLFRQEVRHLLAEMWCWGERNDPYATISDAGHTVIDGLLGGLDMPALARLEKATDAALSLTDRLAATRPAQPATPPAPAPEVAAVGLREAGTDAACLARAAARRVIFGPADGPEVPWDPDQGVVVRAGRVESEILAAIASPDQQGGTQAVRDVLAERRRQVEVEGYTAEHDDQHTNGQLVHAAISYAAVSTAHGSEKAMVSIPNKWWPWMFSRWKPTTPRRDLVKAGALILADIERLDRAAPTPPSKAEA